MMNRLFAFTMLVICVASPLRLSAEDFFPIRRSTPYERGDRWRTDVTLVKESSGTATINGELFIMGNEGERIID